jgi:hypothetical protein
LIEIKEGKERWIEIKEGKKNGLKSRKGKKNGLKSRKGKGDTYKFNVKDLKEGQDYYFRVTAVNSEGPGSPLESNDLAKPRKIIGKGENNSMFL